MLQASGLLRTRQQQAVQDVCGSPVGGQRQLAGRRVQVGAQPGPRLQQHHLRSMRAKYVQLLTKTFHTWMDRCWRLWPNAACSSMTASRGRERAVRLQASPRLHHETAASQSLALRHKTVGICRAHPCHVVTDIVSDTMCFHMQSMTDMTG
jgi:hypothetical protein